jgi:hypothetical protein
VPAHRVHRFRGGRVGSRTPERTRARSVHTSPGGRVQHASRMNRPPRCAATAAAHVRTPPACIKLPDGSHRDIPARTPRACISLSDGCRRHARSSPHTPSVHRPHGCAAAPLMSARTPPGVHLGADGRVPHAEACIDPPAALRDATPKPARAGVHLSGGRVGQRAVFGLVMQRMREPSIGRRAPSPGPIPGWRGRADQERRPRRGQHASREGDRPIEHRPASPLATLRSTFRWRWRRSTSERPGW